MLTIREQDALDWLQQEQSNMVDTLQTWARINSYTSNLDGIAAVGEHLVHAFKPLGGEMEWLDCEPWAQVNALGEVVHEPLGQALLIRKRPDAKHQALLVIHTDTVYPPKQKQQPIALKGDRLEGPGVADAKGGLAVMLWALKAFESFGESKDMGWTVFLNPDEEIGSLGSMKLLQDLAKHHQLGLIFEPALPNGNLVGARKGSGNFSIVVHGKAAHAGREFNVGKNAIVALCKCIEQLDKLNGQWPGVTLNIAKVQGGEALNVVPDLAIGHFNVRVESKQQMTLVFAEIQRIVETLNDCEDYEAELHGGFNAPPKEIDAAQEILFQSIFQCAQALGLELKYESTGGVCDGNKLAAYGLPNIDTLGVQGGNIHSLQEYCLVDSLPQRAQLTYLYLNQFAKGNIRLPNQ